MYAAIALTNMKHEPPTHYISIDSDLIGNNIFKSAASTIIHSSNEAATDVQDRVHKGAKRNHSTKLNLQFSFFYSRFSCRVTVACSEEMQTTDHRFRRFRHLDPSKQ